MADAVKQEETNKQPELVQPETASGDVSSDKELRDLLQKYKDELTAKFEKEKKEWAAQAKEDPNTARREILGILSALNDEALRLGLVNVQCWHFNNLMNY